MQVSPQNAANAINLFFSFFKFKNRENLKIFKYSYNVIFSSIRRYLHSLHFLSFFFRNKFRNLWSKLIVNSQLSSYFRLRLLLRLQEQTRTCSILGIFARTLWKRISRQPLHCLHAVRAFFCIIILISLFGASDRASQRYMVLQTFYVIL